MRALAFIMYCFLPVSAVAQDDAATHWTERRAQLVTREIEGAGVTHPGVLRSMRKTDRHAFIPAGFRKYAYYDMALAIGDRQTISPPFVVAYMTEQLDPKPTDRVLEIGTGSGYQAAILSPLVQDVYTIEIQPKLAKRAERTLRRLGYTNVHTRTGDGFQGWPEQAPFDKILVTCSPEEIPAPLVEQLAEKGQMIIPIGERYQQNLVRITKTDGQLKREKLRATLFVPMTGEAESNRQVLPNPDAPQIINGSFEQILDDGEHPTGWHYLRQAEAVNQPTDAVEGIYFLRFSNQEPGRGCRALQGLAIDGRHVSQLRVSVAARGRDVTPGTDPRDRPGMVVTFYDHRRSAIDTRPVGRWKGTFDWQQVQATLDVPLAAREAIVRVGLLGGTGQLDIDNIHLGPAPARKHR